jgi:uncharacterized RDD family membrane protein YckC
VELGKPLGFLFLGQLWLLFNSDRRALWDFMADTVVVYEPKAAGAIDVTVAEARKLAA